MLYENETSKKYKKWYDNIVERGKVKRENIYLEKHHIIPECFFKNRTRKGSKGWIEGDSNAPSNFTYLTAREHFICHWLLTKMYTGPARHKMINALYMMQGSSGDTQPRYSTKITSKAYANIREEYSIIVSERNTGRVQPEHENLKQKQAMTGGKRAPFSEEWKANISANHKSKKGYDCSLSEETKKKISAAHKGLTASEETKKKISETLRAKKMKRARKICPHCNKDVAVNAYAQFHGDKCKMRDRSTGTTQ